MNAAVGLTEVRVPDMGNFKDVAVIDVLVKPGESIAVDTPLVTLESEKATMDVPSTAEGVVEKLHTSKGGKVNSGDLIATVRAAAAQPAREAEPPAPAAPAAATAPAAAAPAAPPAAAPPSATPPAAKAPPAPAPAARAPAAAAAAAQPGAVLTPRSRLGVPTSIGTICRRSTSRDSRARMPAPRYASSRASWA